MVSTQFMGRMWQKYRQSRLLKSGSWYLVGVVFERSLAFIGVMIFTRLMTKEEYGTVAIYLSWFAIFAATIPLNAASSIQPARFDYSEEDYRRYVSATTILGMLTSGIAVLILVGLPVSFIENLFGMQKVYILLAAVSVFAETPFKTLLFMWRAEYKYQNAVYISAMMAASKLILPVLLIVLPTFFPGNNADGRIYGMFVVSLLFGIYFTRWVVVHGKTLYDSKMWRSALKFGVPLIPHALTGFVLAHFDRILIDRYIGRGETGLYTFSYQIAEIVSMVWYASNVAWVPWFYDQMSKENYALIYKRSTQYILVFTVIILGVIFSAPLLVWLFASKEYQAAGYVVPLVMGGLFFNLPYSLYVNIQMYRKRTLYISIGTAMAAAVNIVLNVLLLPRFGYVAAAWSTLFSYILLFFFHSSIVRYYFKSPVRFNNLLIVCLSVLILLLSVTMSVIMS